jgi:putative transposase
MKRLQAFKYELQPNGEQARSMRRFAGSCRFVFNKALAMQKAIYEGGEKKLGYAGLCEELTTWKSQPETAWLKETHSQVLQQSLKDLERAYKNFFDKRAGFPRFKKEGMSDSFRFPQGCKLDQANSRVFLPKLGWLRYHNSRDILGVAKNITVSANGGKWFVSIQTEREVEQPVHPASSIVGIDVGITRIWTPPRLQVIRFLAGRFDC